jgi:serine acetyltransferase
VVTRDVKPGTTVAGNPAREVRRGDQEERVVEEENQRMIAEMQSGWRNEQMQR